MSQAGRRQKAKMQSNGFPKVGRRECRKECTLTCRCFGMKKSGVKRRARGEVSLANGSDGESNNYKREQDSSNGGGSMAHQMVCRPGSVEELA